MCGPSGDGADFDFPLEGGDDLNVMRWKANNVRTLFNFVDFALGSTVYQEVNVTGVVWVDGMAREVAGGLGLVEVYHR
jgi:hypothetical protein